VTRLVHSVNRDTGSPTTARLRCAGADATALLALPRKLRIRQREEEGSSLITYRRRPRSNLEEIRVGMYGCV